MVAFINLNRETVGKANRTFCIRMEAVVEGNKNLTVCQEIFVYFWLIYLIK